MAAMDSPGNQPSGKSKDDTSHAHVQNEKNKTDKEVLDHHNSLAQAKDRAQLTASTAMSIVSVALLKTVLDGGPAGNRFYRVEIALISAALALQIIAGALGLMVSNMLGYAEKYGKNLCEDWRRNCCPCACKKSKPTTGVNNRDGGHKTSELEHLEDPENTGEQVGPGRVWMRDEEIEVRSHGCCRGCPYTCSSQVYLPYERETLRRFELWRKKMCVSELRAVEGKLRLKYLEAVIDEEQKRLSEERKELAGGGSSTSEIAADITQLEESLKKSRDLKHQWDVALQEIEISREQGHILEEYDRAIRKKRVLQMVSFWQNMLNMILYTVAILNVFITAFGLSDPIGGDVPSVSRNNTRPDLI